MPIHNIRDRRTDKNNYNIQAIFEDSWHSDDEMEEEDIVTYMSFGKTTVSNAIQFANQKWKHYVTLYMYDIGTDNYIDHEKLDFDGVNFVYE